MSPVGQSSRLRIGDRVRFREAEHTVIGLAGTVVRLAGPGGLLAEVTLAELLAESGIRARRRAVAWPAAAGEPARRAAGGRSGGGAVVGTAHRGSAARPAAPRAAGGGSPAGVRPGAVSLTRREQAKAAELTAAGKPVTASAVKQRRRRYEAGGLAAMADRRAARRTLPHGRADQRVVEAMRQAIREATDASTRTAPYVFWRTGQILEAGHGAGGQWSCRRGPAFTGCSRPCPRGSTRQGRPAPAGRWVAAARPRRAR